MARFVGLSLETDTNGDCVDSVVLFDWNFAFLDRFCDGNPWPVVTTGSSLSINFDTFSTVAGNDNGFELEWTFVGR